MKVGKHITIPVWLVLLCCATVFARQHWHVAAVIWAHLAGLFLGWRLAAGEEFAR